MSLLLVVMRVFANLYVEGRIVGRKGHYRDGD